MADSTARSKDAICRRTFWDWSKFMGFTLSSNSNLNRIAKNAMSMRNNPESKIEGYDHFSALKSEGSQRDPSSESNRDIKVGNGIENASTVEAVKTKSNERIAFDDITNLVNAALFYEHLERQLALSRRDNVEFRLIRILVSDDLSDNALIEFAFALNESTRNEDVISRIGDHEFVILLRINPNSPDNSKNIIKRVSDNFEGKFLFSTTLVNGEADSINALELLDKALFKRSTNPD